ncbi:MAG: helicase-exonuclease AddAB subunit AddB [Lachnospiraceae bacterium]|nr:helicase-exonuclease AddAB subunit AddB [Lachnospiraceae bacterium]
MSLQFIMGNSGSGKSHFLYQKVIEESKKHPDQNYMVIVPEQFTMQTQKDLVMLHPDKGIMNIDVLSFRRLAHRIFEEVGADHRIVLTETGKNLMLRKVAIEQQGKLQVLGQRMNKPGYISEVKSVLSELMQYEITDFELQEMIRFVENRPLLHAKLKDIQILYNAFLEYQREKFMKPEELLDVLCSVAGRSQLLRGSVLALDGFAGFTPAQLKVLEELLSICANIWITVTIDGRENIYGEIQEHELFAPSKKLIKSVSEAARRRSSIDEPVILGKDCLPRFSGKRELCHLEQNLFRKKYSVYRYKEESQKNPAAKSQEDAQLSFHTCINPAEEVHFAARTICRLVRDENLRYRDIAVITGNMSAYGHYVKKIFPMYEIPAFLDETRHILLNPCLEFVRGALQAVQNDLSYETVFRLLRTGMTGISMEAVDRLENYVLAAGIRGRSKWGKEWTYLPGRMTPEELQQCNEYRAQAAERMLPFAEKMSRKEQPLLYYAQTLFELLEDCGIQQQLKDRELMLLQEGAREEAREYAQIYSILIALLDEMVELLGDEVVSLREFAEILDAGFDDASVGIIPPGIDQVQVGDIERSRLAHIKVLFFLGLNDGWVPARGDGGGIVSDMEREVLGQTGIELAPSVRENSYIQRFYLYQNLTKPSQRLYLSWCASSGDGSAMRPSYLAALLQKMFPQIPVISEKLSGTDICQITSKKNGLLYLTKGLHDLRSGEEDPAWMELYRSYLQDEEYSDRVRTLVQAAFLRGMKGRLSYQTSKELYGEVMVNSVTRLEQFAACAFAHFAMYGLHLSERELYGVKAADLGIIFHRALELFSRRMQAQKIAWNEISQEEQARLIDECVEEISAEYGDGILHGSAREEYTITRIKRILRRTVWTLHRQLLAGEFKPVGFEVSFAEAGNLESVNVRFGKNGRIRLQGRIDRVDTADTSDCVYVKIVDYKSGNTKFDPVSLYYGLQLQLVVYLNAALEMERRLHADKKVVPAGIFYYHLDDPVLDKAAEDSPEKIQEKLLKKLRPDGVLNGDMTVLRLLDREIGADSLVIPAGLKKDGSIKAASSIVSTEQFEQVSKFASYKMKRMAKEIADGVIAAEPFADRQHTACDYCIYSDVCGFDRKIPGMSQKRMMDFSKKEIWEKIAQEAQEQEEQEDEQTGQELRVEVEQEEKMAQWMNVRTDKEEMEELPWQ